LADVLPLVSRQNLPTHRSIADSRNSGFPAVEPSGYENATECPSPIEAKIDGRHPVWSSPIGSFKQSRTVMAGEGPSNPFRCDGACVLTDIPYRVRWYSRAVPPENL
jgi:hypothetical protein